MSTSHIVRRSRIVSPSATTHEPSARATQEYAQASAGGEATIVILNGQEYVLVESLTTVYELKSQNPIRDSKKALNRCHNAHRRFSGRRGRLAHVRLPNGWRVSGEPPSEARERVRCTRGLGVTCLRSEPALLFVWQVVGVHADIVWLRI